MFNAIVKKWRSLFKSHKGLPNMTDEEIRLCLLRLGFKEESYKVQARIMLLGQIHDPRNAIIPIDDDEWWGYNLLMRDDELDLIRRMMATRPSLSVQYRMSIN